MSAWTPEMEARLEELWERGKTASAIATAVGKSRDAVIGKARRLGLEGRPSPILRVPDPSKLCSRCVKRQRRRGRDDCQRCYDETKPMSDGSEQPIGVYKQQRLAEEILPAKTCQWPEGEVGTAGFHFCGDPEVVPGKPYCAAHCARAYRAPAKETT